MGASGTAAAAFPVEADWPRHRMKKSLEELLHEDSISIRPEDPTGPRFWRKSKIKPGPAVPNLNEPSLRLPRIGSVPYLNAAPLTYGLEDEVMLVPPAQLAEKLRANDLDAALVSVTEILFHDGYDVLDGIAIASHGEVKSVFLAHRLPLEQITEIHCDPASLTSANLLRVLLAERGLRPEFKTLGDYDDAGERDAALLIGDPAISFLRGAHPQHTLWDLGKAWKTLTGLPFVYAVWALRRGQHSETLRKTLRDAKTNGLAHLRDIVEMRREFDRTFRQAYLGGHIRYELDAAEKRGLERFIALLRKHGIETPFEPNYVR